MLHPKFQLPRLHISDQNVITSSVAAEAMLMLLRRLYACCCGGYVSFSSNNNTTPTKVVLDLFGLLVGLWQFSLK